MIIFAPAATPWKNISIEEVTIRGESLRFIAAISAVYYINLSQWRRVEMMSIRFESSLELTRLDDDSSALSEDIQI